MRGLSLTLVRGVPVAATVLPVYEGASRLLQQHFEPPSKNDLGRHVCKPVLK